MASEVFYKAMHILCEDDNKTRTVRVKCYRYSGSFAADTFFSVPANTRVKGKYVHGFVTSSEAGLRFFAHDACKERFV